MEVKNYKSKFKIQLPPIYEVDSVTNSYLNINYLKSNSKKNFLSNNIEIYKSFDSIGVVSSYDKKGITVLRTQPLNLYIIHKNKLKYILKFESIPAVIRIDYNNTTTSRSKLKYDSKESVLELYVLTKQGKLWQIYLIIEKEEEEKQMQLKTNTLRDDDGKIIKMKKVSKTDEKSVQLLMDVYPVMINITSQINTNNDKNKKCEYLYIKNENTILNKLYTFNLLYQSSKLYNFCLFEKYLILYSYKSNIQFMDLSSKKLSSEKIKNISKKEIEVQSLYTIYSTDIPSIENETLFLTIHEKENNSDILYINESNCYISSDLFKKLFDTEKNKIYLIGTNDGEVYWMDTIYLKKPELLINIEEPLQAFHIFNLKKDDNENQKNNGVQQYMFNEAINVKNTPKLFNTNVLMIIGKCGSVILYKIVENESIKFIMKKKYHITNPIYSSCVLDNYLFVTSKYYDGSRKITFYDLYNEDKEEEFKEILIPKIYPSSDNILFFRCLSLSYDNIIYQQLHLNGLWVTDRFDLSNLTIDNMDDHKDKEITNPSKIIMSILEDINKLSESIEEYKQDHKLLNKSIACMNETIFFLISFIDYINKNEYNELPISCNMSMKYHPRQSYYNISISLKFKIPITNHWTLNMNINPYVEEIDSKATIYNVALPNLQKDEQWHYTFNYKNRYQSYPIDISLRLCLSIPESGDVIIPFYIKKFDKLDFIYPWNETTQNYIIENTNPILEESYFNNKQEFLTYIRQIFTANSNEKILETGIRNQKDIYTILVDCNKENSNLIDISKKFLFLTLINPNLNRHDFEKIAKSENQVIFKIPGSIHPIKIVSENVQLEEISPNIQAVKFSIYGDDLSTILSVRQCLLDRIHTISNNIQVNQVYLKSNNIDKDIIYEIKKAIIYTLDTIILSQKIREEKMKEVTVLFSKMNQTKSTKIKTFKYIKKEIQNLYKKLEDLFDEKQINVTELYDNLMELNNLLQSLDSIHMEICFIDRNYLLYL